MSEDASRQQDSGHKAEELRRPGAEPQSQAALDATGEPGLSYPSTLLSNPNLNGRGNGPVRVAVMRQMQQTYGNRATQRYLQRNKGANGLRGNHVPVLPALAGPTNPSPGAGIAQAARTLPVQRDDLPASDGSTTATAEPDQKDKGDERLINELKSGPAGMGATIEITPGLLDMLRSGNRSEPKEPELSGEQKAKYSYKKIEGEAFVGGPQAKDVTQGALEDCYLMAALTAVARANPDAIRRLIKENGDGTYDVTIYQKAHWWSWTRTEPKVEKVTSSFPVKKDETPAFAKTGDTGPKGPELWVMLIEKAYAQSEGGYSSIEGGLGGPAMEALTGKASIEFSTSSYDETQLTKLIANLIKKGWALLTGSQHYWLDYLDMDDPPPITASEKEMRELKIVSRHEYTIMYVNARAKTIKLKNPWGRDDVTLPMSKFKKHFPTFSANPTK